MDQVIIGLKNFVDRRLEELRKDMSQEEYIEARDNFARVFNEVLYQIENQFPEERDLFRTAENKLWKRIHDVLNPLDARRGVEPLNLSGENIKNLLSDKTNKLKRKDLQGANLSKSIVKDLNLSGADLRGTDLRNTNLAHCVLIDADLRGADLRDTIVDYRTLEEDLENNFVDTVFRYLAGANFTKIIIDETTRLDPAQVDYFIELNNNEIEIFGLDKYLAHHRPAARTSDISSTTTASAPIDISATETATAEEEYHTPNSSFSDHSINNNHNIERD